MGCAPLLPAGEGRTWENLEIRARPADEYEMWQRYILAALLSGLLSFTALGNSGCFVLDELDSGSAFLDNIGSGSKKKAEVPIAKKPDAQKARPSEADWWKKAHSLSPTKLDASIVQCTLGGSTQFMRRTECEARGGHAG